MPHNDGMSPNEIAERIASIAEKTRKNRNALMSADDIEAIKADVLYAVAKALDRSLERFKQ